MSVSVHVHVCVHASIYDNMCMHIYARMCVFMYIYTEAQINIFNFMGVSGAAVNVFVEDVTYLHLYTLL